MTRRDEYQALVDRVRTGSGWALYADQGLRRAITAAIHHCESFNHFARPAWHKIYQDLKEAAAKLERGQFDLSTRTRRK